MHFVNAVKDFRAITELIIKLRSLQLTKCNVHGLWVSMIDKAISSDMGLYAVQWLDLFFPRSDSFPVNQEKKPIHSLIEF